MPKHKTEDEVRDLAKEILGLKKALKMWLWEQVS